MNWNPYKRPDYKNMSDAELDETQKKLTGKMLVSMGVNLTGALICAYVVAAAVMPALLLPAIPVFYGTTLIAIGICSSNRFTRLGSACREEKHDRLIAGLSKQISNIMNMRQPEPQPAPAPAPAFNGAAATVLDDDLEINKPLQFKKKAPGATA